MDGSAQLATSMTHAAEFSLRWATAGDAVPMHFGEMDYGCDPEVLTAIQDRLRLPLLYPPPTKSSPVSETVAGHYRESHGLDIPREAFWFASGALAQNAQVMSALVGPGDVVLCRYPMFPYLLEVIRNTGATARPLPSGPRGQLSLEALEAALTPETKAIYLVNPHNPTGESYSPSDLQSIADAAVRSKVWVVSNELHSRLTFQGRHTPFAQLSAAAAQASITLSGASKSHNLAGIGGSFAFSHNLDLLERVRRHAGHAISEASSVQQVAMTAAYRHDSPWLVDVRRRIRSIHSLMTGALSSELPTLRVTQAKSTYFLWMDLRSLIGDADAVTVLRSQCGILACSGLDFGVDPSFARLTIAVEEPVAELALKRLVSGLRTLPGAS
ncbi:aminotransferase class I/II-fold pyridoxal phosphate-dependent enzyme [Streptomyces sp. NPDC091217]|uniref:aminotransferase class I/II-fold pyridoxal phosphate-dependent enzyme n=1 Tax=Streptomyces sp. NPDC091217 TaxID=3365975 RepID=UPI00380786D0